MIFNAQTRLLVVAAHPDDETLGCGGTIAKAISEGAKVRILFLGEGISARFPIGQYDSDEFKAQTATRHKETLKALKVLGVKDVHFGDRLCCQFDKLPILSIVKEIEEEIRNFNPDILFTHSSSEVNIDHGITFEAVEIACRPTNKYGPKSIYTFEVVCSGRYKFISDFQPNVFVDISKFWEKKLKAWKCYENETRAFPFPRSPEGLETLARYRGMSAGLEKAEAFYLARQTV